MNVTASMQIGTLQTHERSISDGPVQFSTAIYRLSVELGVIRAAETDENEITYLQYMLHVYDILRQKLVLLAFVGQNILICTLPPATR